MKKNMENWIVRPMSQFIPFLEELSKKIKPYRPYSLKYPKGNNN